MSEIHISNTTTYKKNVLRLINTAPPSTIMGRPSSGVVENYQATDLRSLANNIKGEPDTDTHTHTLLSLSL